MAWTVVNSWQQATSSATGAMSYLFWRHTTSTLIVVVWHCASSIP
jgi:hypothetical protein